MTPDSLWDAVLDDYERVLTEQEHALDAPAFPAERITSIQFAPPHLDTGLPVRLHRRASELLDRTEHLCRRVAERLDTMEPVAVRPHRPPAATRRVTFDRMA